MGCNCGKKALPSTTRKSTAIGAANAKPARPAREPRTGGPGQPGYAWLGPKRRK